MPGEGGEPQRMDDVQGGNMGGHGGVYVSHPTVAFRLWIGDLQG